MSLYGPPGGPYPGQPQDPWQDGSADDPYGSGYPDPLDRSAGLRATAAAASRAGARGRTGGYGQRRPSYGQRAPVTPAYGAAPSRRRLDHRRGRGVRRRHRRAGGRSGTAVGVIIVVVLLAAGRRGRRRLPDPRRRRADAATGRPARRARRRHRPSPSTSASAANADAKVAKAGDCLVNKGNAEKPDMQKVTCAANTYQVLKRIDGTADKNKCEGTANSPTGTSSTTPTTPRTSSSACASASRPADRTGSARRQCAVNATVPRLAGTGPDAASISPPRARDRLAGSAVIRCPALGEFHCTFWRRSSDA